jgi:outer membrane protein TolC
MARAVKYNLDHQVKRIEEALARGNLDRARYDLLPQLVASARYSERNNENGSASRSLITGAQSLEFSTSQEKQQFSADIIQVWNVLDFGVGYTQALQTADEVLISEEWRRKAVQNIVQNVRYAYWKAVSAEQLLPEMDRLLKRVEQALERAREMEKTRAQDPVKTLAYQQELLETVKLLWSMRRELSMAKTELAALMNMEPGVDFALDMDNGQGQAISHLLSLEVLEGYALEGRPELRIESYNKRISSNEVKKAMLSMLPGLEINLNANYDDNVYLYNNSWLQAGLSVSWNVFNLLSGPKTIKVAEMQQELADRRYLATAMMVLTQVHLAHQSYYLALKEYDIADQLEDVLRRRLWHAEAAKKALAGSEQEEIRNQAAALSAKMNRGLALAQLHDALGRVLSSTGTDPLPSAVSADDLEAVSRLMEEHEGALLTALQGNAVQEVMPTVPAAELEVIEPETADLPSPEKGMAQESVSENGLDQEQEQASREPEKEMEKQEPTAGTEADQEPMMDNAQPDQVEVPEAAIEETVAQPPAVPEEPRPAEVPEVEMIEEEETPLRPTETAAFETEKPPPDNLWQNLTKNVAETMEMEDAVLLPTEHPSAPSAEDQRSFRLRMKSSTLPNLSEYRTFRRKQGGLSYRPPENRDL